MSIIRPLWGRITYKHCRLQTYNPFGNNVYKANPNYRYIAQQQKKPTTKSVEPKFLKPWRKFRIIFAVFEFPQEIQKIPCEKV